MAKTKKETKATQTASKKSILIVDDEPSIRQSLVRFLEHEQYRVKAAINGREALALLKKEKFDLVLLDMLMPGSTGLQIAKEIRVNPNTKNQKFMFLTVVGLGEQGKAEVQKLKPEAYIQKPFEIADLRTAIKKAVG